MFMLSQLLRFHVADAHGRHARLVDASLGSLDCDYPLVDLVMVRDHGDGLRWLPWTAITAFDRRTLEARVDDLEGGQRVAAGEWPPAGGLGRDVLGKILIDLRHPPGD